MVLLLSWHQAFSWTWQLNNGETQWQALWASVSCGMGSHLLYIEATELYIEVYCPAMSKVLM